MHKWRINFVPIMLLIAILLFASFGVLPTRAAAQPQHGERATGEVIVTSSEQLQQALADGTVHYIRLGADIEITHPYNNVKAQRNESTLVIDGLKYDAQGAPLPALDENGALIVEHYYTLTGLASSDKEHTIRLREQGVLDTVQFQNLNIVGRNWYGIFSTNQTRATAVFERVHFTGPQMFHEQANFVLRDSVVEIVKGVEDLQEVAEARSITLGGKVTIRREAIVTNVNNVFWLNGGGSGLTAEPNAEIYVDDQSGARAGITVPAGFIYSDVADYDFSVGAGASFFFRGYGAFAEKQRGNYQIGENAVFHLEILGRTGMSGDSEGVVGDSNGGDAETNGILHVNNLQVGAGASLIIETNGTRLNDPVLRVQHTLLVDRGEQFHLAAPANIKNTPVLSLGTESRFQTVADLLIFNSSAGAALKLQNNNSYLEFTTRNLSYWAQSLDFAAPANLPQPSQAWSSENGPFTVGARMSSRVACKAILVSPAGRLREPLRSPKPAASISTAAAWWPRKARRHAWL